MGSERGRPRLGTTKGSIPLLALRQHGFGPERPALRGGETFADINGWRSPMPVFARVLVGVDGSDAAYEACRQVASVAAPGASIEAFTVVHIADALAAGADTPHLARLEREAEEALARAAEILRGAETRSANGFCASAILAEAERFGASLIALGSHEHRRLAEILVGGVAGDVLHSAPCSVLIARPSPLGPEGFPGAVVVGVDGSVGAEAALAAAGRLAFRTGASLRAVAALRGKGVDLARVRIRGPAVDEVDAAPVGALVEASKEAGLVVVGSRGLHGPRALGSVSERVAHRAACSVLVVR
jgi:nucleotide-binding universal stress UspA family protein